MQKLNTPDLISLRPIAKQIILQMKTLQNTQKWIQYHQKPCQMYKIDIQGVTVTKGIHIVEYSLEEVVQFLSIIGILKQINPLCIQDTCLFDQQNIRIVYMKYTAPWPIHHRDFVTLSYRFEESKNKVYLGAKSCNFNIPEQKNTVRGQIIIGGYILQRVDQKRTRIIYISYADVKGAFPRWVKNQLAKQQGEFPVMVQQAMKKHKK